MVMLMSKLIGVEWIKFKESRKNRMILLLIVIYLIGLIFNNQIQYNGYFTNMERSMKDEKNKANGSLGLIQLLEESDETYISDAREILFFSNESRNSLLLEYHYKDFNYEKWEGFLEVENQKFSNLIQGEENGFISESLLNARGQNLLDMRGKIYLNEYLIDNQVEPYLNPYEMNGVNFMILLLKDYTPLILIVFGLLLSLDIFSKELEEGSYKMYYTQPYTRKYAYWSKILSALIFGIGAIVTLIVLCFLMISMIYGFGEASYPQIILTSQGLMSLTDNSSILGEFQIVSSIKFIALGYLMFIVICGAFISMASLISLVIKSTTKTLGLLTSIILLDYILDIFIKNSSILKLYYPLSYFKIDQVLAGKINASYLIGLIIGLVLLMITLKIGEGLITKMDLLGGDN